MSLQLFADVLQREISSHLGKLERKSIDAAPAFVPSDFGSSVPASPAESPQVLRLNASQASAGISAERMDELRRLADQMSANLLHRLAKHSSEWGLEEMPGLGGDADRRREAKAFGQGRRKSEACVRLEQQIRELEGQLAGKKEEANVRQGELIAKCKAEFATVLNAREQEILEVQKLATFDEASARSGVSSERAETVRREFAEHMELTHKSLGEARKAVEDLDNKRQGLDKIEAMQKRAPYSGVEELLAKYGAKGTQDPSSLDPGEQSEDDDEYMQLWAAIEKGEQVAKKMRHAVSGA